MDGSGRRCRRRGGAEGRLGRHPPLPWPDALSGPYSTLLSYWVGDRERVPAAFPVPDPSGPPEATLPTLWQEPARRPARFDLRTAASDEPWRTFASLSPVEVHATSATTTIPYDLQTPLLVGRETEAEVDAEFVEEFPYPGLRVAWGHGAA